MGNLIPVTPALANSLYQITAFNSKVYAVDFNYSLYSLNNTENDWDLPLTIKPPGSTNTFKFVEFESKLYLYNYAASDTAALLRLNDTADAVIPVCNTSGFNYITHACVFNGRLFAGALTSLNQPVIVRLDVSGDDWDWELVCTADNQISSLASFNGKLFVNTFDVGSNAPNGFYKLNDEGTALDHICFFGTGGGNPTDGSVFVFNNRLYYGAVYELCRLNLTEDGFETISSNITYPQFFADFHNQLYIGADALNRLNSTETGCDDIWSNNASPPPTGYLRSFAVKGSELFLICDLDLTLLYKYISLIPNPVANRTLGYKNLPLTFWTIPFSDYPLTGVSWDFGDGTGSSDETAIHSYLNDGTYSVSLTASNLFDTTTTIRTDYVQITDSTVIYIHSIDELQLIGDSSSYPITSPYQLAHDIDAKKTATWNGGLGFAPIVEFRGDFNGAGHKISHLHINRPTESQTALFSTLTGATFSNLSVENALIVSGGNVAVLASLVNGLIHITNCNVSGTVSALSGGSIGGFFTTILDAIMALDCTANVTAHGSNSSTGGFSSFLFLGNTPYLFGPSLNGIMSNCQITHIANGLSGMFGGFSYDVGYCFLSDCTVFFRGTGQAVDVGGFFGYSVNNSAVNCHVSGLLNLNGANTTGGFAGYNSHDPRTTNAFINCSADVDMTSSSGVYSSIGGFIGYGVSNVIGCHSSGDIYLVCTSAFEIGGFGGYSDGPLISCYSTGNLRLDTSPFSNSVSDVGGLLGMRSGGNYPNINCYATGDVIIVAPAATSIGGYAGYLSSLETVENCFASGNVLAGAESRYIGGFAGWTSCNVYHCNATGDVSGGDSVGGFAGVASSVNSQCFSLGNVFASGSLGNSMVGGFAATGGTQYINCFATGNVLNDSTSPKITGGFIGSCGGLTMTNCYSIGRVENIGEI